MKIVGTHWEHTWNTMMGTTHSMHARFEIQAINIVYQRQLVHLENLSDGNVHICKSSAFIE